MAVREHLGRDREQQLVDQRLRQTETLDHVLQMNHDAHDSFAVGRYDWRFGGSGRAAPAECLVEEPRLRASQLSQVDSRDARSEVWIPRQRLDEAVDDEVDSWWAANPVEK